MSAFPKVSIIVPVLDREKVIGRCMQSLLELDYPSYEIIVVDNGSSDRTPEIVSGYPVKLITELQKGPYAARNTGIQHTSGEMICFIDSDCLAHTDWLKKLVRNFTDERVAGVGGQLQTHEPETLVEQFEDYAGIMVYNLPKGVVQWDRHKFLSGAVYTSNVMFKKETLLEVGGFDPEFLSGGDFHLCWQIQRMGYRLLFDPEAIVRHVHRSTVQGLMKQFCKYGIEQPRLLTKQPDGLSFIKLKTYLLSPIEMKCKLPWRMLINIDSCNLFVLCLVLTTVFPMFLYLSLLVFSFVLLGTLREAVQVVKKSGNVKWLVLFPYFHLIRNYSFTLGRICGGIRHKIISM